MRVVTQTVQSGTRKSEYSDFEVIEGKLYRHVLHDLDFEETPLERQCKRPKGSTREAWLSHHGI